MELSETVIEKEEVEGGKTEIFDLARLSLIDSSFLNVTLINSPDKITKDVLNEFSSNSKPVNLITLDKSKWVTTVINFDIGFLYVNAPSGFKIYIGELVIVQFSSENNDYIIQTVLHKYTVRKIYGGPVVPVLSLRFLDPRIDKRYQLSANTDLNYKKIGSDACWLTESNYFLVRNTSYRNGENESLIINETIGKGRGLNSEGIEDISYLDKEMGELRENMQQAEVADISIGGCAIIIDNDEDIKPGSLLLMSIIIDKKDAKHILNKLELQLLGVVRNARPAEGAKHRFGVKFANKINNYSVKKLLEEIGQINPVLKI